MSVTFKIAREQSEFEQISLLNYETFVEEIPQHSENEERALIDKFHDENTYIIGKKAGQVIGMICVRASRPFSLDSKIGRVEESLPVQAGKLCEIRLLAVHPNYRNGRVFLGLVQALIRYCLKKGYDTAVISGTTRELKLYEQMGFQPFADITGAGEAQFLPMYLTKETFERSLAGRVLKEQMNFLPGPVRITDNVTAALAAAPFSHRSAAYGVLLQSVKSRLIDMTGASNVQLLHGTGTMANDVIAAQLSLLDGKGLILCNGEFGKRLVDHAERFNLSFCRYDKPYGDQFDVKEIELLLMDGDYEWVWAVHCETSTGVLLDAESLGAVCDRIGIKLCLDCISSLGTVPVNLRTVEYASGVSGKGLSSYTGLSFVFHRRPAIPSRKLPRYLDLGSYEQSEGIPYSQSSNLTAALEEALKVYDREDICGEIRRRYNWIRTELEGAGLDILARRECAAPGIMTVVLPREISSLEFGEDMHMNGFSLHYESSYLQENNWVQICCISPMEDSDINRMLKCFLEGIKDAGFSRCTEAAH